MPTENYDWKLGLDYDDVVRGFDAIHKTGQALDKVFEEIGKDVGRVFDSIAKDLKPAMNTFEAVTAKADKTLNAVFNDLKNIDQVIKQSGMKKWEKLADNYARGIKEAKAEVKLLQKEMENVNLTLEERVHILKKIRAAQNSILALEQKQGKHVSMKRQAEEAEEFRQKAGQIRGALQDVSLVAGAVGIALSAGIKEAFTTYSDFQAQLNTFNAMSGATEAQLKSFEQTVLALGGSTRYTAQEVAATGVELVKMGVPVDQVEGALRGLVDAADASGEGMQSTARVVVGAMNAWGLSGEEAAQQVGDIMVKAANEAQTSVSGMGDAAKYAASAFAAAGQPIEDMAGLLVLANKAGIQMTQAGNGLQNMMLRLQKPTAAGVDILKKYRIEIQRADGSMRNVIDILGDMRKNLEGLSGPAKAGIFKDLFGEVSTNTMQAIFNTSEKGFNDMIESMRNAGGTSEETAKKIRQGPQQAILEMASAFERAKIEFSKTLEPVFTAIIKGITGVINWFNNLPEGVQTVIAVFGTVAAAAGVIAGALGALSFAIGPIVAGWPLITGAISGFVSAAIPLIGSVMAAIAPFLALAGALYFAWQTNLGGIRDLVEPMLESIGTWFEKTFIWIKGEFNKFLIFAGDMWDNLVNMFYTGVGLLDVVLRGFLSAVGEIFSLIAMVFTGNFKGAWDSITVMTANGSNALLKTFGDLFSKLKSLFGTAWKGLTETAAGAWDVITNPMNASNGIARMQAGIGLVERAAGNIGTVLKKGFMDGVDDLSKLMSKINVHGRGMVNNAFAPDGTKAPKKKDPRINLGYAPQSAFAGTGNVLEDNEKKAREKKQKEDISALKEWVEAKEKATDEIIKQKSEIIDKDKEIKASTEDMQTSWAKAAKEFVTSGKAASFAMSDFAKSVRKAGGNCAVTQVEAMKLANVFKDEVFTALGPESRRGWGVGQFIDLKTKGFLEEVKMGQEKAGDIIAFLNSAQGHIGSMVDNKTIMHSTSYGGGGYQRGLLDTRGPRAAMYGRTNPAGNYRVFRWTDKAFKNAELDAKKAKEAAKEKLSLEENLKLYEQMIQKRNEIASMLGKESKAYEIIDKAVESVSKKLDKHKEKLQKINEKIEEMRVDAIRKLISESVKEFETEVKNIESLVKKTTEDLTKQIEKAEAEATKITVSEWDARILASQNALNEMDAQHSELIEKQADARQALKDYIIPEEATAEQKARLKELTEQVAKFDREINNLARGIPILANAQARANNVFRAEAIKEGIKSIVDSEEALNDYNKALAITSAQIGAGMADSETAVKKFFDQYFKGVQLTTEETEKLNKALGIKKLQNDMAKAAEQAEYLTDSFYNVAKSMTSLIGAAGETGAAMAGFLDFVIGGVEQISAGMAAGGPAGAIIAGVGVAIEGAASLISQHHAEIEANLAREEERIKSVEDAEIRALERRLEARQAYGQSVIDIENQIINTELARQEREIQQQYAERKKQERPWWMGSVVAVGGETAEQERDRNLADVREQAENSRSDSLTREAERTAEIQREADRRLFEDRANIAKMGNDKLAQIEADAALERYNILSEWGQLINEALARGEDISTLEGQRNNALAVFDKNTADQRKEIVKQQNIDELNAQFDHQQHLLNMKTDSHAKTLDLMRLERDRQAALWQEELAFMDVNSQEYKDLTQKKADYIVEQNRRIQDSIEENNKAYKRELADLRTNLEILKAQGTEDTLDDVVANNRKTLEDLIYEEQAAYDEMLANYGENQEMRTAIAETFAQRRANLEKAIFKEAAEAMIADYEAAERKKVDALIRPLQRLVNRDLKRIEAIDKQNEQYQRQIELIDEANEKLKERFEETDTTQWRSAIEGVDLEKALTEGISYIANEDVQGEVLGRSSRKNQLRGLTELLDKDERMAKASLDLEEIDKAAFNAEMTRIFTTRAAAIEATMAETENEEELADLKEELAQNYLDWKDLEISKIEETRSAERRQAEDAIRNNNRQKRSVQDMIDSNKIKISEYEAAHEEHMIAIREQFAEANQSAATFGNLLGGLGAKFGSSANKITSDLSRVITKVRSAIDLLGSYGGGPNTVQSYSGSYGQTYNQYTNQETGYNPYTGSNYTSFGGYYARAAKGGEIPGGFNNDTFPLLTSSQELMLDRTQNMRLDKFLTQAEQGAIGLSNQSLVFYNTFNNEGDWQRFQSMMDQYARYDNKRLMRRMGQSAQSRVN